jgi:hypothetical protein
MKAIYSGCILDPWLDVAERLFSEGVEPVYWIGWNKKGEEKKVKGKFPKIIFHSFEDAWKGKFPKETEKFSKSFLDPIFFKKKAFHENISLRMMDRMDLDRKSFNFNQRQRLFRQLVRKWKTVIDNVQPNIIISPSIPHRVFDYALYVVAKERKIPFLTYQNTYFDGLIIPVEDVYNLPEKVYDYRKYKNFKISSKIIKALDRARGVYEEAEPDYMKSKKIDGDFYKLKSIIKDFTKKPLLYINFLVRIFNSNQSYYKDGSKNIEESNLSFFKVEFKKWRGRAYKEKLKKYYNSLTVKPNLKNKYILIALHYQPEATSTPSAGIFTDQFLMIDMLSKMIPKNWKIYVKEHTAQFYSLGEGETSREKFFYDDVKKIENVDLIPTNFDTFKLIDNSVAVATLTGTIGFESAIRKKPVLVFGNAWYSPLKSVFQIKKGSDLVEAIKIIGKGFKYNNKDLLRYLSYIENKIGVCAYHYKGRKKVAKISREDSVEALSKSIKYII